MSMTGAQVLNERRQYELLYREVTEEDRGRWVRLSEFCRTYPEFLDQVQLKKPKLHKSVCAGFRILAVEAKAGEWRSSKTTIGGRPEQLLPGTKGSFSTDVDWRYWLLMGGRGCVAAGTMIESLDGPVAVEEWAGGWLWAVNSQGRMVPAVSSAAYVKGSAPLFRVRTDTGDEIVTTDQHRFLTPLGWKTLAEIDVGESIASTPSCHPSSRSYGRPSQSGPRDDRGPLRQQVDALAASPRTSSSVRHTNCVVVEIEPMGVGVFYDLTVPGYENYVAEGLINHNSGKSRTGAEAIRELLFGTKWTVNNVRVAFVGRTLQAARSEMFLNTFMQLIPEGCIIAWRSQICELVIALPSGGIATINGYSADAPDTVRGPNLHLAWADEIAAWNDADRAIATEGTAFSNLNYTLRAKATDADGNEWRPRLIATTTPKSVRLLRNKTPLDPLNPGVGLADTHQCVVSSMSTLDNLDNLAPSFYESSIEPYIGTRLYRQEVLGELMDEAVGAEWSGELIDAMYRWPSHIDGQAGGLLDVVIGVDPATIDDPENAEHGIVVTGLAADGSAYVLDDATFRGRPSEVCDRLAGLAAFWGASRVVVEINNGGTWITETMGRAYPNLPIVSVWAKKGKKVRAQPIALLSDKGRVFLAGSFPHLEHQMMTYTGKDSKGKAVPSPDRLDAFVYSVMFLLPVEGQLGEVASIISDSVVARR